MPLTTFESDVYVAGSLAAQSVTLPAGAVQNNSIVGAAGIEASKLQHQHQPTLAFGRHTDDAAAARRVLHRVNGATGTIVKFGVGASAAAGAASSATIDLKKNGSSILSATITLDNTTAAFTLKQPSGFSSTALVAGDVLEIEITAVSGANLPKGVYCQIIVREDAA